MISSLANFLVLMLYRGMYPERVSWTLLMFTLGAVGIARIAIEQDRSHALGYGGILGFLAFIAMLRFVDSPIFSAFILAVIAYLADIIVRDCTLIEEDVDASGQGLMDSGRMFVKAQMKQTSDGEDDASDAPPPDKKNAHQPGRTIMYLALAALPLFGLGQFFLRGDSASWSRAQFLLATYLFSALSLLVTTSFLGLRRYLRQREVDMPGDVSVAWLGGGLAMIALVLFIAHLAPLPGSALASMELAFLDSPDGLRASRFGWGDEGAEQSDPNAASTADDPNQDGKEIQDYTPQEGAPPGDVGDGQRDDGPTGSQQGGDQSSSGGESQDQSSSSDSSSQQRSQSGNQSQQQQQSQQGSQQQQSEQGSQQQSQQSSQQQSQQGSQQQSQQQSQQSSQQPSESSEGGSQNEPNGQQGENQGENSSDARTEEDQSQSSESAESQSESAQREQAQNSGQQSSQENQSASQPQSSPPSSSSPSSAIGSAISMLGSLIKLVIFVVLAGVVAAFLWKNWHLIAEWWANLFQGREQPDEDDFDEFLEQVSEVPRRPFSSFRNPIGKESDARRVIVITFQAFDAWTREQGTPRGKDETPSEFIRRVAKTAPNMTDSAPQLVDAYNRIVYGRGKASESDLAAAKKVWNAMQAGQLV